MRKIDEKLGENDSTRVKTEQNRKKIVKNHRKLGIKLTEINFKNAKN